VWSTEPVVNVRVITASAGSGKTYRLTQELEQAIVTGRARPESIVATTFTKQSAAELIERARARLLRSGHGREAHELLAARIGTVNAVCGSLVSDFAFELGMTPELRVLDETTSELEFRRALARVVTTEQSDELEGLRFWFEQELDWRLEVRRIVDAARANGTAAGDLPACGERSIRDLDICMGACAADVDLDRVLADAIAVAMAAIAAGSDTTKGTADYMDVLRCSARDLAGQRLRWGGWAKLTSGKPTKKSLGHAAAVQSVAARHVAHPRLRSQMHALIRMLFRVAADGLDAYEAHKRERGVIDFVDQETLALGLLRRTDVRTALAGQIDLVLVDEFQDTSPIQLAVFLELAALATESVWVGDPKQAIYGFRGTDPSLMDAAIESLTSTTTDADLVDRATRALSGGTVETLGTSYRSRPALVAVTSEIFARAFAHHGMAEVRTRLRPSCDEEPAGLGHVLEYWPFDLEHENAAARAGAVAAGVRDLLGREVRVRDHDAVRGVRRSDVAVLCRTNRQCQEVADALGELAVPAVVPRMELFDTTEVMVLIAGMHLWVDPGDSLAAAEIARLISYPLNLDAMVTRALAAPGADAFREDPTVARIVAAREARRDRDPLAVVDAIIEVSLLRKLCAGWGNTALRLANLDALRSHAATYVEKSLCGGDAPTLVGLLRRFTEMTDASSWKVSRSDSQALLSGEDAVTVSTWHRAKGLEWPITVLFGLESLRDPQSHGVHVMSDPATFDVNDPLNGRWIRFWPNPYTNNQQKGPVRDAFERSSAHATLVSRAEREALRVLYVGWTRARDRLVFAATRGKLLHGLVGRLSAIDPSLISEPAAATPGVESVSWAGRDVSIHTVPAGPAAPVESLPVPGAVTLGQTPQVRPAARMAPSSAAPVACGIGELVTLGPGIAILGSPDMEDLGHAVHGFLAADRPGMSEGDRLAMATEVLQRFRVDDSLAARDVLVVASRFWSWLHTRFAGARLHREYPIAHRTETATIVAGTVDLVVRSGNQAVVIDHKSFAGRDTSPSTRAAEYSGQLAAYAAAIRATLPGTVVSTWIHYPILGHMVELVLDRTTPRPIWS
jgi:ATP-dependent helicase/nuclease subunit A